MTLTSFQLEGKIKSIARKANTDPIILMRLYMMERFLERLSLSEYKNNFIIKGGVLITSLLGISLRTTMDIDSTIQNLSLKEDNMLEIVKK